MGILIFFSPFLEELEPLEEKLALQQEQVGLGPGAQGQQSLN